MCPNHQSFVSDGICDGFRGEGVLSDLAMLQPVSPGYTYVMDSGVKVSSLIWLCCNLSALVTLM